MTEFQEAVHECEVQATQACDELKQKLAAEKEKARNSWKTSCEHLAKQDVIITAQEEELASLKQRITELEAQVAREREVRATPPHAGESSRPSAMSIAPERGMGGVDSRLSRDPSGPGTAPIAVATVGHVLPSPLPHSELPPSDAAPDSTPGRVVEDSTSPIEVSLDTPRSDAPARSASTSQRRSKDPPIEFFSGQQSP